MEGPYSARFPSSPVGETSRRATVIRGAADDRACGPSPAQGRPAPTTPMDETTPDFAHVPVMRDEVVEAFEGVPAGWVVDATLGGAGHSVAVLDAHPALSVLGIDQDPTALAAARSRLARFGPRARTVRARFDRIRGAVLDELGADAVVSGVLFDLGVSSPQLDVADRGFSYRSPAPLDMRMDPDATRTAADVVNGYAEADLARVLRQHGDERYASRIAKAIVAARPVTTTSELADLVRDAIPAPARRRGGHPAKRTFQAVRIEVNAELEILPGAIDDAIDLLVPGGRIVVLAYHSGEDRIVKERLRQAENGGCTCPPNLPCVCGAVHLVRPIRRGARKPGDAEREANPRAESARLRVAERLDPEVTA